MSSNGNDEHFRLEDFKLADLDCKALDEKGDLAKLAYWRRLEYFIVENEPRFVPSDDRVWDPSSGVAPSFAFLLSEIRKRINWIESLPKNPMGRHAYMMEERYGNLANRVSMASHPPSDTDLAITLKDPSSRLDYIQNELIPKHFDSGGWRAVQLAAAEAWKLAGLPTSDMPKYFSEPGAMARNMAKRTKRRNRPREND